MCPRAVSGPIFVKSVSRCFRSLVNARDAIDGAFLALPNGPLVTPKKDLHSGTPPQFLRVDIGSDTAAVLVCVTWTNAFKESHRSYFVVPPGSTGRHISSGARSSGAPHVGCMVTATETVHAAVFSGQKWTRFLGMPWPKWSAVLDSPCASSRYHALLGTPAPSPPAGQHVVATTTCSTTDLEVPITTPVCPLLHSLILSARKPAYRHATGPLGGVTCAFCGTTHSSLHHFIARCAPDASD